MPVRQVLIPWRGGDPHREAARRWVTARWEHAGYDVHLAEMPHRGAWCKAEALAGSIRHAADPVIVADADLFVDPAEAVQAVEDGAPWAVPHLLVHRLTRDSTTLLLAGGIPEATWRLLPVEREPYPGIPGGGLTVLRRDVAYDVPMDSLFKEWGGEDDSWGMALATLAGNPWRGTAPLIHLWHPPPDRLSPVVGNMESEGRRRRYYSAWQNVERTRLLVEEGRAWPRPSP